MVGGSTKVVGGSEFGKMVGGVKTSGRGGLKKRVVGGVKHFKPSGRGGPNRENGRVVIESGRGVYESGRGSQLGKW